MINTLTEDQTTLPSPFLPTLLLLRALSMAPATGHNHRAFALFHQGNANLGKRDADVSPLSANVPVLAATIAILGAIIVGKSPFCHIAGLMA